MAAGGRDHGRLDDSRHRGGVVGNGAGDRGSRPEPQAGDDRPGDAADAVRADAGAAPRAVAAADVRPAQRHDLRRDDPVARGQHVHAARGGHRPGHRRRKGYAGDYGPAIEAWLDTPGGVAVAPNGDVYIADSNNHVIRRIDAQNTTIEPVAGNHDSGNGFSGDNGLGDRGAARYAGRRRDRPGRRSHRRRFAQRPHPARRPADRRHHDDRRVGRERLRRRRQARDRGGAQHAERRRGGAERRHLHRRHAELPRAHDRREDRPHPHRGRRRHARRRACTSATADRRRART